MLLIRIRNVNCDKCNMVEAVSTYLVNGLDPGPSKARRVQRWPRCNYCRWSLILYAFLRMGESCYLNYRCLLYTLAVYIYIVYIVYPAAGYFFLKIGMGFSKMLNLFTNTSFIISLHIICQKNHPGSDTQCDWCI